MQRYFLTLLIGAILSAIGYSANSRPWRSSLYPDNWQPGHQNSAGQYLPDYAYAGYRSGLVAPPARVAGAIYDVTRRPFSADSSGQRDATAAIQRAIDAATAAGGGTVYLPAGTYRLRPGKEYALRIAGDNILLKGDGPGKTFLFNDAAAMRRKQVILIAPAYADSRTVWNSADIALDEVFLNVDVPAESTRVRVPDTSFFRIGERILLRNSITAEFVREMNAEYPLNAGQGVMFYRQIVAIDAAAGELILDAPTRFTLKVRDRVRITRLMPPLEGVGVAGFSFAMRETLKDGFEENDHAIAGTAAYEVHASVFLQMNHVVNSWIHDLASYRPAENSRPVGKLPLFAFAQTATPAHILSKGIVLESSRHISIDNVDIRYPQYLGGGSNGYLLQIMSNDILVTNSTFVGGRHNVMIAGVRASGNVIHNTTIADEYISSDHHGQMSAANLFDQTTVDGAILYAGYNNNPSSRAIGPTTSQTTYWNTTVGNCQVRWRGTDGEVKIRHFVVSHQHQWGYVIGSRGSDRECTGPQVRVSATDRGDGKGTEPEDVSEGIERGAWLQPQSLYLDQLAKRRERLGLEQPLPPTATPDPEQPLPPSPTPDPQNPPTATPSPQPPTATPSPEPRAPVAIIRVASGSRYALIWEGAQVGQRVFRDRPARFSDIPAELRGLTLLQTADEDRVWEDDELITLRLRQPATLYVAFDTRMLSETPDWLAEGNGWVNTGQQIALSEEEKTHTLFRKRFSPGRVELGGAGLDSSYFNYYVLIDHR